jgi:hypothetical protein
MKSNRFWGVARTTSKGLSSDRVYLYTSHARKLQNSVLRVVLTAKAIASLNSINRPVFVMETPRVFCETGIEFLNII